MHIFLAELERLQGNKKEVEFSFTYPEIIKQYKQVQDISPVEFVGNARVESNLFLVTGRLTYTLKLSCSRCLGQFQQDFIEPFKEFFGYEQMQPQEETEDRLDINWLTEDYIDLPQYCKESIVLSLPYIPLCDSDCKGLCPVCGQNHNEGACNCKVERIDPRLAALADFFDQKDNK